MAIALDRLIGVPPRISRHRYTQRDTMLYALGVGAGQDPLDRSELRFVYEEDLVALPTMALVLAYPGFWPRDPQYGIDWRSFLHAEQAVTWHSLVPCEGAVRGELEVEAVVDKGLEKGALLQATRRIYDETDGTLIATLRQSSLLRGDGGCGTRGTSWNSPPLVPERRHDAEITLVTRPEQALLYRLSGDDNPLHADPETAAKAALPRPILHGLCTFGFAARALLKLVGTSEPGRLRHMECRFTAPVFPGDQLTVQLWKVEPGEYAFRIAVAARNVTVIDRGRALIDR
jgi:acyl dehydratase